MPWRGSRAAWRRLAPSFHRRQKHSSTDDAVILWRPARRICRRLRIALQLRSAAILSPAASASVDLTADYFALKATVVPRQRPRAGFQGAAAAAHDGPKPVGPLPRGPDRSGRAGEMCVLAGGWLWASCAQRRSRAAAGGSCEKINIRVSDSIHAHSPLYL